MFNAHVFLTPANTVFRTNYIFRFLKTAEHLWWTENIYGYKKIVVDTAHHWQPPTNWLWRQNNTCVITILNIIFLCKFFNAENVVL